MRLLLSVLALVGLNWGGGQAFALELTGPLEQGGLVVGQVAAGSRVEFEGRSLRVSASGTFLLGFGRDAPDEARLRVVTVDGRVETHTLEVAARDYRIQRIDGLPQRKVTPAKQDLERIRRESALVREARRQDDPRTDFLAGFILPINGRVSGVYGSQRILNGKPRRPHMGTDIAAPTGTPVHAPADGKVTLAEPDLFFSGGTLILDHGFGLSSSFLHLSRILVHTGERVLKGQVIAEVGATGRVTGPHLHWGMNLFDTRLDPQLVLRALPADRKTPALAVTASEMAPAKNKP